MVIGRDLGFTPSVMGVGPAGKQADVASRTGAGGGAGRYHSGRQGGHTEGLWRACGVGGRAKAETREC